MTDLRSWLDDLGLGALADTFAAEQVEFDDLSDLTDDDLKGLGVPLEHSLISLNRKGDSHFC